MSINQSYTKEVEREIANTRQVLERLNDNDFDYKPHPKSMTLGELANHIVELHGWVVDGINKDIYDFQKDYTPLKLTKIAELIQLLDEIAEKNKISIAEFNDEKWFSNWKLMAGDHLIAEMPKVAAMRFVVQNHLIHHRGQLTVYMRLLDLPLPGIYGPSADEN